MDFNWEILLSAILVISGWLVVHRFAAARDLRNKRKQMRIDYLIGAWRKLESVAERKKSDANSLESALADIQLFGTDNQVAQANEFMDAFVKDGSASLTKLLNELRLDLRKELKIGSLSEPIRHLRLSGQLVDMDNENIVSKPSAPMRISLSEIMKQKQGVRT